MSYRETNFDELTLGEAAEEYVKTIYSAPNGWGQHAHPTLGISHNIMRRMWQTFGEIPTQEAISRAMQDYAFRLLNLDRNERHRRANNG